jgi:hypothetical protein
VIELLYAANSEISDIQGNDLHSACFASGGCAFCNFLPGGGYLSVSAGIQCTVYYSGDLYHQPV